MGERIAAVRAVLPKQQVKDPEKMTQKEASEQLDRIFGKRGK